MAYHVEKWDARMNFLLSAVTIDFFYSVLHFDKAGDMQKPETANLMYKVSQIDHFHLQLFSAVQSHCIIYRKGNRYRVTYFIFNYTKVPINRAAHLFIFKVFSYQHALIWT